MCADSQSDEHTSGEEITEPDALFCFFFDDSSSYVAREPNDGENNPLGSCTQLDLHKIDPPPLLGLSWPGLKTWGQVFIFYSLSNYEIDLLFMDMYIIYFLFVFI